MKSHHKRVQLAKRSTSKGFSSRFSSAWQPQFESLESRQLLDAVGVETNRDIVDGDTSSITALRANPGLDNRISLREAIQASN